MMFNNFINKHINGVTSNLNNNYYEFDLPQDYFHYKRSTSIVNYELYNHLKKEGDVNMLLNDEFWKAF